MKRIILIACATYLLGFISQNAQATKLLPKPLNEIQKNTALSTPSFIGIALDQPFPGEMLECPKDKKLTFMLDFDAIKEMKVSCYQVKEPDKYYIWNSPDLGVGSGLEVYTFNGNPLVFRLIIGRKNFLALAEIFKVKYGAAHRSGSAVFRTRNGDKYIGRDLQWEGSRIRIKLCEIGQDGEDVNWGEAIIQNVELSDMVANQKRESISRAASKL